MRNFSNDDLHVICQDWSESDPYQSVAIDLAKEVLRLRDLIMAIKRAESNVDALIDSLRQTDQFAKAVNRAFYQIASMEVVK